MQTIPVVVPGIMGSSLTYDHFHGDSPLTLWSSDLVANYERLISQPGTLRWNGNRANAKIIVDFTASAPLPLFGKMLPVKRVSVWSRTLKWIRQHPSFNSDMLVSFGYDWRAPLRESAELLCEQLKQIADASVSSPRSGENSNFTFFAHSMGGIVVMIAIGMGKIHPSWIDRIVLIGSPLRGAPSAFSAAYKSIDLPFFSEIFGLIRRNNQSAFYKNLLDCIGTFPSIYSLFPPEEIPYLYYGPSSRSNPLREDSMASSHQDLCRATHLLISQATRVIEESGLDAYAIYTEVNSHRDTDLEYRVTPHGRGYGYRVDERIAATKLGDGTVPADSACGKGFKLQTVVNVDHAFLCNDPSVVECLATVVPQVRSYAS